MNKTYDVSPMGDSCILFRLGEGIDECTHRLVMAAVGRIEADRFAGYVECVPAFASVAVYYEPAAVWRSRTPEEFACRSVYEIVLGRLTKLLDGLLQDAERFSDSPGRIVTIPVCYGGSFGPDLEHVANHCGLSPQQIIDLHSGGLYLVHMIGFAPGFPYLGGMPRQLAVPRRETPRAVIPAGSVGIAGAQTGVYPLATPGGWQLIGRTPVELFRPDADMPSLLQAGDRVRFQPITADEFDNWKAGEEGTA
ncbi:5-oxoprolinase subunit PxpB [Paenibacillus nanensis]|uniref:5-oxoprolinase subunit PxpB n=1 Tax=Paenibacillus nanensis TaxID=393251 RepID=A0A3A1VSL5_9BACL|nr:5-oxoprolinase subunit PxpB [Paenibacillus nanensis]RIX60500.1 5-oxoprolinase subunit PxpB [Paenibacillus nanensis]